MRKMCFQELRSGVSSNEGRQIPKFINLLYLCFALRLLDAIEETALFFPHYRTMKYLSFVLFSLVQQNGNVLGAFEDKITM
jgi:hypothetical protein